MSYMQALSNFYVTNIQLVKYLPSYNFANILWFTLIMVYLFYIELLVVKIGICS